MKEFYVQCVETCPECNGRGVVSYGETKETWECLHCKGTGRLQREVSLADALNEIATDRAA